MFYRRSALNISKFHCRISKLLSDFFFLNTQRKGVFVALQRDRDLELAARIGQALLKRNHVLSEQNEALEEQLGQAFDQVSL